ncbi:thiol-disulfide oxidoreductase ResA [Abditibacteriota bacterium]|nr:thiol-disulfide oxidoreductase ResA [Abditibacteriota bacterium]
MKNLSALLLLLAVAPGGAVAQPNATPSQTTVEPAAKTLLDGVTATYHAAKGVRFKLVVDEKNTQSHFAVSFQKPNLLRVETHATGQPTKFVSDGKARYSVEGTTYKREPLPEQAEMLWAPMNNGTGFLMSAMLDGHSPIVALQKALKSAPFPNPRMTVVVPPLAVVDGVSLNGVKINLLTSTTPKSTPSSVSVIYLWFDPVGLLSRISTSSVEGKTIEKSTEQISDQQLDPTFAPDTFKFNATGLKLAPIPTVEEQSEFDPRLKVGTAPLAFSAKTLKGQTVSLANYKGKVLILDFWATWCGPCVASMPELKSVYAKYHPKGLEVVGISLDEDKSDLTSYIKTNKITWSQVFDGKGWESRVPHIYGVKAIPFFLVVGKNGKIAAVDPRDDLEGAVKKALAAS